MWTCGGGPICTGVSGGEGCGVWITCMRIQHNTVTVFISFIVDRVSILLLYAQTHTFQQTLSRQALSYNAYLIHLHAVQYILNPHYTLHPGCIDNTNL